MDFIYPDLSWYSEISDQKNVSLRCPYANVHRCPRYYSSLYLLGNWNKSDLLPVITEHDTSIMGSDGNKSGFSNFCPEVSFDIFGLFAVSLFPYTDGIKTMGSGFTTSQNIKKNGFIIKASIEI